MEKDSSKQGFLKRLQTKWKLDSLFQVVMVLVVFACTGFTIYKKSHPKLLRSRAGWWPRVYEYPVVFAFGITTLSNLPIDLWLHLRAVSVFLGKGKTDF